MKIACKIVILFSIFLSPLILKASDQKTNKNLIKSTPNSILENIARSGAKSVVNSLYSNDEQWNYISKKIASGNISWLKVARALLEGSDAGSTEMLTAAVGEALVTQPSYIFKIFGSYKLELICNSPDVDSVKFSTKNNAIMELDKRLTAVKNAKDLTLIQKKNRDQCLKNLEESRAGINSFFKE